MWFMPSYGRPERLRELLGAPGGWPASVVVLVNQDDPERVRYQQVLDQLKHEGRDPPWKLRWVPPGSRCADAHREIMALQPNEPFYGLLCDDQWPITPGWHETLVTAAGSQGISTPAGEPSFPLLRNALVIGGELARAMGSLVPAPVKHNFEDNIWDDIARQFNLLKTCPEVIVEHRHWIRGQAEKDATYQRGSADFKADRDIYQQWLKSPEKMAMNKRISEMLNAPTMNVADVKLAILMPVGDHAIDIATHNSLVATLLELQRAKVRTMMVPAENSSNVGFAREGLMHAAIKTDATHFMWLDSDMGWEPQQLTNLLAASELHDFVAIPGVRKQENGRPCVVLLPGEPEICPQTGYLSVESVGFAFVMMKRSVIEKMQAAYPELEYSIKDGSNFGLFCEFVDKGDKRAGPLGTRVTEDVAFCRRWRAIDGEIWVDPHGSIIHAGRKEYTGSIASFSATALERQRNAEHSAQAAYIAKCAAA